MTRAGRQRKMGRAMGCSIVILAQAIVLVGALVATSRAFSDGKVLPEGAEQVHTYKSPDGHFAIVVGNGAIDRVPFDEFRRRRTSAEEYTTISVGIVNLSPTKLFVYKTWRADAYDWGAAPAVLVDEHGNTYRRVAFGIGTVPVGGIDTDETLYPQKSVIDVLVFERPVDKAQRITLKLPLKALGGDGIWECELERDGNRLVVPRPPPPPPPAPRKFDGKPVTLDERIAVGNATLEFSTPKVGKHTTTSDGNERRMRSAALLIEVKVTNTGDAPLIVRNPAWNEDAVPPKTHAGLASALDANKTYQSRRLAESWAVAGCSRSERPLAPKDTRTYALLFDATAFGQHRGDLTLTIPLACVGAQNELVVSIPQTAIEKVEDDAMKRPRDIGRQNH